MIATASKPIRKRRQTPTCRPRRTGSVHAKPLLYADFSPRLQVGPNLYAGYYAKRLGMDPIGLVAAAKPDLADLIKAHAQRLAIMSAPGMEVCALIILTRTTCRVWNDKKHTWGPQSPLSLELHLQSMPATSKQGPDRKLVCSVHMMDEKLTHVEKQLINHGRTTVDPGPPKKLYQYVGEIIGYAHTHPGGGAVTPNDRNAAKKIRNDIEGVGMLYKNDKTGVMITTTIDMRANTSSFTDRDWIEYY